MHTKDSWFVLAREKEEIVGIGECSLIEKLSPDRPESIVEIIDHQLRRSATSQIALDSFPAARFALETLEKSVESDHPCLLYDTPFSRGERGIEINGLIWMGSKSEMFERIKEKISEGFTCLKLKIGAIEFEDEIDLLKYIRGQFSKEDIELRVDANGAFSIDSAMEKLKRLSAFDLHSIEQPIGTGQWEEMAALCTNTPLPIALDEELIGVTSLQEKEEMLSFIRPQYIILKPSLIGGIASSEEWIELADRFDVGWWATSALEGNIGLNTIAQWMSTKDHSLPQGLGTGGLYTNNIDSPLVIRNGALWYDPQKSWDMSFFNR